MEEAENMRLKLINVVEKSSPISSTQQKQRIEWLPVLFINYLQPMFKSM